MVANKVPGVWGVGRECTNVGGKDCRSTSMSSSAMLTGDVAVDVAGVGEPDEAVPIVPVEGEGEVDVGVGKRAFTMVER